MRRLFFIFLLFVTVVAKAVTFDIDGTRYNVVSMEERTVEVAIIPKSISYPTYSTYTGDIVIPEKVSYNNITFDVIGIGDHAFSNSSIKSISIPNSVRYIGFGAFAYAYSIKAITLPEGLLSIGAAAFRDTYIIEMTIPNSVKELGTTMFYYCNNLKTVVLPEDITEIPEDMFYGCPALVRVDIPSSVKVIGSSAFMGTPKLAECTLPAGLESLGAYSFYHSGISSITIPDGVTVLGEGTFYKCQNLEHIDMPKYLESIGKDCFRHCSKLKSIEIPEGVSKITSYTFQYCSELCSLTLPSTLKVIDSGAFSNCTNLTSLVIPEGVTDIYTEAFYGTKLSELSLPSTLVKIDTWAFGIKDMKRLVLPASLTTIGGCAFDDCAIEEVVCLSSTPLQCETSILHNDTYLNGKLIVPVGSAQAYRSTSPWNNFFFVEEDATLGIDGIGFSLKYTINGNTITFASEVNASIYTVDGRCIADGCMRSFVLPYKGCFIVRSNLGAFKVNY